MSIYFSTHKKKKTFPFALFGFIAILFCAGMAIYLMQKGVNISYFTSEGYAVDEMNLVGFAMIVTSFLIYILGLGINREIKTKYKFPLYAAHFIFLGISATAGYFMSSYLFPDLMKYLIITGNIYFAFLIIYFLLQHRIYSRYFSRTIMVLTSLPIIPFLYGVYKLITGATLVLSTDVAGFDNIVIYTLLLTMLLYTAVNSVYLSYINRRVL
ncbi:MAG: hypothetical protein R3232_05405 [Clostridia bacterium]|nr:hypothetical protein [Clostridia bacterium]